MKSSLPPILATAVILTSSVLPSAAATLLMSFNGLFTKNTPTESIHSTIKIGDTYSYSIVFTDQTTGFTNGRFMASTISSVSFLVNDTPWPITVPDHVAFTIDDSLSGRTASLQIGNFSAMAVGIKPAYLPEPLPTPVGFIAEFSDFLAFNALNPSSIELFVPGDSGNVAGPATSFNIAVVPETGAAVLCGAAGLALVFRRTRGTRHAG